MKKYLIAMLVALALCLSLALVGCSGGDDSAATDDAAAAADDAAATADDAATGDLGTIKVGFWGGTCEMAVFTAMTQGYLEDEGFTVEPVNIGAADEYGGVAGLIANGEMDLYLCTPTDIMSMEEGLGIYFTDSMHTGCFEACATPESGIKTVEDLAGKKIGTGMIGNVAYVQIMSEVKRLGGDPEAIEWVVYDNAALRDAMKNGEVDGIVGGDQLIETCVEEDGAVRFFSDTYDDYLKDTLCCFVGMNAATVDANPEVAKAVSRAMKKATDFVAANPEEAAQAAFDAGYLVSDNIDRDIQLVKTYTWLAGDETRYTESFKEHLAENQRAGLLPDAPEWDSADFDAYAEDFIAQHGRFSG